MTSVEVVKKMTALLKHRGPDDEGYYIEKNIGLGHRRLSIIDLSPNGHQPMQDYTKRFVITYNGEIYNYIELRKQLEKKGHTFRSKTDTEVILNAYLEWGIDCLSKFNGMWSFAIFDRHKNELFCSRDRFGVKPFYYYKTSTIFAFASEIKPLLLLTGRTGVSEKMLYDFLRWGILNHEAETFFDSIFSLPLGSYLYYKNGMMTINKFWDFSVSDTLSNKDIDEDMAIDDIQSLFQDSIRLRLRSDVPIGTALSGGLDSSFIVYTMKELLEKSKTKNNVQHSFSAVFPGDSIDESQYIKKAVNDIGIQNKNVTPTAKGFLEEVEKLISVQEEPFAGTSIYGSYKVMELAHHHGIKVLLNGQGGDELFCGYRKFYLFYLMNLLAKKRLTSFLKEFFCFFAHRETLQTLSFRSGIRYIPFLRTATDRNLSFFDEQFLDQFRTRRLTFGYQDQLGNRLKEDITKWSLPVLLRYEDKNSMNFSIETRLPFLDYRLIEYIGKLPINFKMRNGFSKYILRKTMKNVVPDMIRLRRDKLGFSMP